MLGTIYVANSAKQKARGEEGDIASLAPPNNESCKNNQKTKGVRMHQYPL